MPAVVFYRTRSPVDDWALSALHAVAFGSATVEVLPWGSRLDRHSLVWVQAFVGDRLVGFVNVAWDGGSHAFLLDTVVHPDAQRQGIGAGLVQRASAAARDAGCVWLHVDHEPQLRSFYRDACGFRPTEAGLLRLSGDAG